MSIVSNSNSDSVRALSSQILGNIRSAGRESTIPSIMNQKHMMEYGEHVIAYANTIANAAPHGAFGLQKIIKLSILEKSLTEYAELVKTVSFFDSDGKLAKLLDSKEPMATIETAEDFPVFQYTHAPQLQKIYNEIKSIRKNVDVLSHVRYIPSFDPHTVVSIVRELREEGVIKTVKDITAADKAAESFQGYISGSKKASTEVALLLARLEETAAKFEEQQISFNLWELLVIADSEFEDSPEMPLLMGTSVHHALSQTAYPVLPFSSYGALDAMVVHAPADKDKSDVSGGWIPFKDISKAAKDALLSHSVTGEAADARLKHVIANIVFIAATQYRPLMVGDITLPIGASPAYGMMQEIFAKGYRSFFTEVESDYFGFWRRMAQRTGQTLRTAEIETQIDTAVYKDANAIPAAFLQKFEAEIQTAIPSLLDDYISKKYVYTPIAYAPHENTTFKCESSIQEVRDGMSIRITSDFPVALFDKFLVKKPAGSEEALLLSNKMDGGNIFKGSNVDTVIPLMESYFQHIEPQQYDLSRNYSIDAAEASIISDARLGIIRDLSEPVPASMKISDILQGSSMRIRDDMEILRSSETTMPMTLARTATRLSINQNVIHMPNEAATFGVVQGSIANPNSLVWAKVVQELVARVYRRYLFTPIAEVRKELKIAHKYENKSYLRRKADFEVLFTKVNITDHVRMNRFLSHYLITRVIGEKLDLHVFDHLNRADLWVNSSLHTDLTTYALAIAKVIKENFNTQGTGLKTFIEFVRGDLTEVDMIKLKTPGVSSVINAILDMTMVQANKDNTIITLVLLNKFIDALSMSDEDLKQDPTRMGYDANPSNGFEDE